LKNTKSKKSPTILIIAAASFVMLLTATIALFLSVEDFSRLFSVSNFTCVGDVYFHDGSTRYAAVKNSDGLISVDYVNPESNNYIKNLRVDVKYSGYGVGLIRVRVAEEWSRTSEGIKTVLPNTVNMPYTIASPYGASTGNQKKWFDNRDSDQCFYYATPVYSSSGTAVTIPLITDFDADEIDLGAISSSSALNIAVEVDAVQVNRYPQFWGINALPWANALSGINEGIAA
jgi:hypothetical protein